MRRLQCESCYDQHNATHCFLKFFGRNSDPIFLLPKGTKNEQRSSLVHDKVCDGPQCRSEGCIVGLRYSCADCLASFGVSFDLCEKCYKSQVAHDASHAFKRFDKPVTASTYTYVVCPPQQKSPIHSNIFCHGPNCKAVGFIAGTRYTCAYCPPSVDLCQDSYKSEAAHDASHPFKRYDNPMTTAGYTYAYAMCPPQRYSQAQPPKQAHSSYMQPELSSVPYMRPPPRPSVPDGRSPNRLSNSHQSSNQPGQQPNHVSRLMEHFENWQEEAQDERAAEERQAQSEEQNARLLEHMQEQQNLSRLMEPSPPTLRDF